MTAVATVATWRPRDGKINEFVAKVATAKKIHERLGGKVRVWQTAIGGQPMTFGYVIEHASWAEFAKFSEKMEKDTEWQSFWADASAHVTADLIQNSLVTERSGF
ncbi:MAG TPA: hypothetical protein VK714_00155 [Myxococcota bacterium]|nr:hypothetical protein [Myxococcota bacterium]